MELVANKYCASITPRTFKMKKPKKRLTASQLKCNGDDNICLLTKTPSPLFGKRLWEMRHGRAVYISVLHHSSWKVYLPLEFVNYLITQPIWLGVSWAQYEKFAHKVSIKEGIYDGMDTDHDCSYKRVRNWKHQNPNSTNPAAQTMIYVITWNRIARKLTDIEFLNLTNYVPRNAYVHFPEILGTCCGTHTKQIRTFSWKLLTVLLEQTRCFDY